MVDDNIVEVSFMKCEGKCENEGLNLYCGIFKVNILYVNIEIV